MTSYMRQTGYNSCLSYKDFFMLVASKMIIQGVSMPFVGNIANKIGPRYSYNLSFHFDLQGNFYRFSILIGSGLYSFGYIMTYLSVQSYFALAVLTLSLHGLAFGFVYATAIKSAQVCPTFYI